MTDLTDLERIKRRIHELSDRGVAIGFSFRDDAPADRFYTYDQAWLLHYQQAGLIERDPTILFGFSTNGVRSWSDLEADGFDNHIFKESRRFGIENGTVFSLRVNGSKTIASISHKGESLSDETKREVNALLAAGTTIVDAVSPLPALSFSEDQKALITYILAGTSDEEICEVYGFDRRTLRRRRDGIIKAADAKSLPHLVHLLHARGMV